MTVSLLYVLTKCLFLHFHFLILFQHPVSSDYVDKEGDFVHKAANSQGNCLLLNEDLYCSHPHELWDPNGVMTTAKFDSQDSVTIGIGFARGCRNIQSVTCQTTVKWSDYTRDTNVHDVWFRDDQCFWSLREGGKKLQDRQGNYLCYAEQKKSKKCHEQVVNNPYMDPEISSDSDSLYFNQICSIEDYHFSMQGPDKDSVDFANNPHSPGSLSSSGNLFQNTAETGVPPQAGSGGATDISLESATKHNLLFTHDDSGEDTISNTQRKIKRKLNSNNRRGASSARLSARPFAA